MKKIILSFMLLVKGLTASADHWTAPSAYDYPTSTPVYVKLNINGGVANADSTLELAAFVGDECRAIAKVPTQTSGSENYYLLRVLGDSKDKGDYVDFRVFYNGLEYALAADDDVLFDEKYHMPVELTLDAISGIQLENPIFVTAQLPYSYTLNCPYLYQDSEGNDIVRSGNSSLLSELTISWDTFGSDCFNVTGNKLNMTGECVLKPLQVNLTGPKYADGQFSVNAAALVTASYPVSFNYPSTIEVDKFATTTIALSNVIGTIFNPAKVSFEFPTEGGIPVAVTSYFKNGDVYYFNVYGNMAGQNAFSVYYDGEKMGEGGQINVNGIGKLASGWSWLSLYSVDADANAVNLKTSEGYEDWVHSNVSEFRSQFKLLCNDPKYGYFGDIDNLNVTDGMYKVNAINETTFSTGNKTSNVFVTKEIRKGYNWLNNPYQLDLSLSQIASALQNTPSKGDMIIGKDDFIEYNGTEWDGSIMYKFEAGKGYMYYSVNPSTYSINFNKAITYITNYRMNVDVRTEAPSAAYAKVRDIESLQRVWNYDASRFADNMVMVADVEGLSNLEDYSVGAFVGAECRGEGKVSMGGKMFINVAGQAGETVTFKLCNKNTGEITDLNESVKYTQKIGSSSEPLSLTADVLTTGISSVNVSNADIVEIRDVSGRKVSAFSHGIYLVTYMKNGNAITKKVIK